MKIIRFSLFQDSRKKPIGKHHTLWVASIQKLNISCQIPTPAKRLRYEKRIKGLSQRVTNTLNFSSIEINKGQRPSID